MSYFNGERISDDPEFSPNLPADHQHIDDDEPEEKEEECEEEEIKNNEA